MIALCLFLPDTAQNLGMKSSHFCSFWEVIVGLGVVRLADSRMSCNREQLRAGEPYLAVVGTGGGREVGGGGTYREEGTW